MVWRVRTPRPLAAGAILLLIFTSVGAAQAPARGRGTPSPATRPVTVNLAQLMRSILLPNSNVIFAAQQEDFASVTPVNESVLDPSLATDPIKGIYPGWEAVENASLALVEASGLITAPGRRCSNGRPVPRDDPQFTKMVDELRAAAAYAYGVAQTKSRDQILDAAEKLSVACSQCHLAYREKVAEGQGGVEKRCLK
jgi:hypothetical protein